MSKKKAAPVQPNRFEKARMERDKRERAEVLRKAKLRKNPFAFTKILKKAPSFLYTFSE